MIPAEESARWRCACGGQLTRVKVGFAYMKGNFEVELPACSDCGQVLLTAELAEGKMAEAERILEDK